MPVKSHWHGGWSIGGMPCRAVLVNHQKSKRRAGGDWVEPNVSPDEFPIQHRIIVPYTKYAILETYDIRWRFGYRALKHWYGVAIPGLTIDNCTLTDGTYSKNLHMKVWDVEDPVLYDLVSMIRMDENISGEMICHFVSGFLAVRVVLPSIYFENEADAVIAKMIINDHPNLRITKCR